MGLLAELVVRTYYESQGKRPYLVGRGAEPACRARSRARSGAL